MGALALLLLILILVFFLGWTCNSCSERSDEDDRKESERFWDKVGTFFRNMVFVTADAVQEIFYRKKLQREAPEIRRRGAYYRDVMRTIEKAKEQLGEAMRKDGFNDREIAEMQKRIEDFYKDNIFGGVDI